MSEARLNKLAKAMAREILGKGHAKVAAGLDGLSDLIARELKIDQRIETEIEQEARALIAKNRNLPPPGTGEYQAALTQARQTVAIRRGFKL
jgi:hypothetical protein